MFSTREPWDWLSLHWLLPETFAGYVWENKEALYLLPLIPVFILVRLILISGKRKKLSIALPEKELKWRPETLLRHIPPALLAIVFALLTVALARPQKTTEQVEQWTEGIDIMLAIDISESMEGMDFKPNRLEAAKKVALDFVNGRFRDRIGLVIFSGEAYSLCPLTTDYDLLTSLIKEINYNQIQANGTAIGSAIAVATNRMRESNSKSKVLIVLSDGENNAGNIDPITAAEIARTYDVKLYAIAIGREGRVPYPGGMFGQARYYDNMLDETTLRRIAEIGGGRFFRASDNKALEEVFSLIDQYEKVEIKETRYTDTVDYYHIYLMWAIAIFLVWLFLKSTFVSNALLD